MGNTFLQHCEEAASDPISARGLRGGCLVNLKALRDLIFHFKRLDHQVRSEAVVLERAQLLAQGDADQAFESYLETFGGSETDAWHDAPVSDVFKDG